MDRDQSQPVAIVGDGKMSCHPCATSIYGRRRLTILQRDEDFVQDNSGGYLRGLMASQVPDEAACDICGKKLTQKSA